MSPCTVLGPSSDRDTSFPVLLQVLIKEVETLRQGPGGAGGGGGGRPGMSAGGRPATAIPGVL